ncbi:hypothetical protein FQN54_000127 [Arachnomyces sp. PD_36]|nr:hypothetical protein FQN54_000127 [Arachnomyces sp. PD_36]
MKGQLFSLLATALFGATRATGDDILGGGHGFKELSEMSGRSPAPACSNACSTLSNIFNDRVASSGDPDYINWGSTFWSQQQGLVEPHCVFQPSNASDVSTALLVLQEEQCPFAIRSGGHAAFSGASNIDAGVTFDMRAMNATVLSSDRKTAHVGSGAVWKSVFTALEPEKLAVIGGRVSNIGVGGLTLGGGISFFSGQYGWACDNVENYEVVLADGDIVNVNIDSFPDLYWALRGGGNNFGIVTRFDLKTFEQGLMWGGSRLYPMQYNDSIVDALVNFGENADTDPKAALILSFAYAQGQFFANADIEYAEPVADPPIFDDFKEIPAIIDSMAIRSLPNITDKFEQVNPSGLRESYWTATYKLDKALAMFVANTFMEEIEPVSGAQALVPSAVLQVITPDVIIHMEKNGGNALGLSASDGPLMLLNVAIMWADPADDEAILQAASNIVSRTIAKAKEMGLDYDYLYMNYASQFQDVIPSYGHENHKRLRDISRKYDPDQVFQKLQPGYFKLNGGPPEEEEQ